MESKAPDYLAPLAGARSWKLPHNLWTMMGGCLWSAAMIHVWPDNEELVAKCDTGHKAPAPNCSCGVYAWFNPEIMQTNGYAPRDHTHISGVVAGRGDFIRGADAPYWVAESAMVLAFLDDGYPSPKVETTPGSGVYLPTKTEIAEEVYGVELIKYHEFNDFCDEYGLVRFN